MAETFGCSESFTVVGLEARVSNDDPAAIAGAWARFHGMDVRSLIPERVSEHVYCVFHDYEGDHRAPYRMTIGFRVAERADPPEGLSRVQVPAQRVARIEALGKQPETLIARWGEVWNGNLKRAFVADFDCYDDRDADRVTITVGLQAST